MDFFLFSALILKEIYKLSSNGHDHLARLIFSIYFVLSQYHNRIKRYTYVVTNQHIIQDQLMFLQCIKCLHLQNLPVL